VGKKKKLAKRVSKMLKKDDGITQEDVWNAGLGVLADSATAGKSKIFNKARKRGIALAGLGIDGLSAVRDRLVLEGDDSHADPSISYQAHGGGWYNLTVDGIIVDRIQGEVAAAERASELLESFTAQETAKRAVTRSGIFHNGGGWYEIVTNGVPIHLIKGKEAAEEKSAEIAKLADAQG